MIFTKTCCLAVRRVLRAMLAVLVVFAVPCLLRAADQVVTNEGNSGVGSLRQAIADVGSGETITFAPGLSGATISLLSRIDIYGDLSVDASALPSGMTISGGNSTQIFFIAAGATVHLTSLTLRDGKGPDGAHGPNGMDASCSLFSGTAGSAGGDGGAGGSAGAIFNLGSLNLRYCSFLSNVAGDGGNGGNGGDDATLCYWGGNDGGDGGAGGSGGAIFNNLGAVLDVQFCTFAENYAGRGGQGGVSGTDVGIASLSGGGDGGAGGSGGAIYNLGSMTLQSVTLSLNQTQSGGESATGGTDGLPGSGGGLFSYSSTVSNIQDSLFAENVSAAPTGSDALLVSIVFANLTIVRIGA